MQNVLRNDKILRRKLSLKFCNDFLEKENEIQTNQQQET